jgi:uncharacterized protein
MRATSSSGTSGPSRLRRLGSVLSRRRGDETFDLFTQAGDNARRAAERFAEMLRDFPDSAALAAEIRELEHEGDRITHELIERTNRTFVTAIERGDVLALASAVDDVVDLIEEAADFLNLYHVEAPMAQAQELADLLCRATAQLAEALPRLRGFGDIRAQVVEIHSLENAGDATVRRAIGSLFEEGIDPMAVIRWKDIFERLEEAIDSTERAAFVLEGIVIKNA